MGSVICNVCWVHHGDLAKANEFLSAITPNPCSQESGNSFFGFYDDQKVVEKTVELEQWMKSRNLLSADAPNFARYNPPWTLPFMRRNEVMISLRD